MQPQYTITGPLMKIKKKFQNKLVSFYIMISTSSIYCSKKWLDEKPDMTQVVPSTLDDFQALMDNADQLNTFGPALGEISSDGHYLTESSYQSRQDIERNAYTWSHNYPYLSVFDWNNNYLKIFYCNLTLEGIQNMPD